MSEDYGIHLSRNRYMAEYMQVRRSDVDLCKMLGEQEDRALYIWRLHQEIGEQYQILLLEQTLHHQGQIKYWEMIEKDIQASYLKKIAEGDPYIFRIFRATINRWRLVRSTFDAEGKLVNPYPQGTRNSFVVRRGGTCFSSEYREPLFKSFLFVKRCREKNFFTLNKILVLDAGLLESNKRVLQWMKDGFSEAVIEWVKGWTRRKKKWSEWSVRVKPRGVENKAKVQIQRVIFRGDLWRVLELLGTEYGDSYPLAIKMRLPPFYSRIFNVGWRDEHFVYDHEWSGFTPSILDFREGEKRVALRADHLRVNHLLSFLKKFYPITEHPLYLLHYFPTLSFGEIFLDSDTEFSEWGLYFLI